MKYLSNQQIQESIRVLFPFNAFFFTTFLVLKREGLPVNSMKRFSLDAVTKGFLNNNFRVHPKSEYFFRIGRPNDKSKDWVKPDYASTGLQSINTRTFYEALLHGRKDNTWGWASDYVQRLATKLPRGRRIPLFHLSVWLYKYRAWEDNASSADVVDQIIEDYQLTEDELNSLFQSVPDSNLDEEETFQSEPVKWHELLAPFSRPEDVPSDTSGILRYLETTSIGPAAHFEVSPSPRLNLLTGDNGLGKTFLLDLAWWALTQDWPSWPATPGRFGNGARIPQIKYLVEGADESQPVIAEFINGRWSIKSGKFVLSGLAVYACLDGSFAIWDPANLLLAQASERDWPGLKFTREEVWNGNGIQIEGLIRDLVKWQQRPDLYPAFHMFQSVVKKVYPPDLGEFSIGGPIRIPNYNREIPTLKHPYGDVPILFESAGIKRILTIAYLLVWVWEEHKLHAMQQLRPEERQMVILVDEAEAHLHPKWQRLILPGLLTVAQELHAEMSAQWIISTHSPLVLASIESTWDKNPRSPIPPRY